MAIRKLVAFLFISHRFHYLSSTPMAYLKDTPKSKSGIRDIPMLNTVVILLKDERKKQLEQRMMLGNKYGTKTEIEDLVFTGLV